MSENPEAVCRWLPSGDKIFEAIVGAVAGAQRSIRLEIYHFRDDARGRGLRDALVRARERGLKVRVLLDGFGSKRLPSGYWNDFERIGGEFRWFNPSAGGRAGVRDLRNFLVCDATTAFIGGLSAAEKQTGDGVARGHRHFGLQLGASLAEQLATAFDEMFRRADEPPGLLPAFRLSERQRSLASPGGTLLLSAPGRQENPLSSMLLADLQLARSVQIVSASFLPGSEVLAALIKIGRRGGRVQMVLPGKTDSPVMRAAAQNLYKDLLEAGVEIYEYQPQVLRANLIRIDEVSYTGSLDLDTRSLRVNYQLMVRVRDAGTADAARDLVRHSLEHCRRIELDDWRNESGLGRRLREKKAHFIVARLAHALPELAPSPLRKDAE